MLTWDWIEIHGLRVISLGLNFKKQKQKEHWRQRAFREMFRLNCKSLPELICLNSYFSSCTSLRLFFPTDSENSYTLSCGVPVQLSKAPQKRNATAGLPTCTGTVDQAWMHNSSLHSIRNERGTKVQWTVSLLHCCDVGAAPGFVSCRQHLSTGCLYRLEVEETASECHQLMWGCTETGGRKCPPVQDKRCSVYVMINSLLFLDVPEIKMHWPHPSSKKPGLRSRMQSVTWGPVTRRDTEIPPDRTCKVMTSLNLSLHFMDVCVLFLQPTFSCSVSLVWYFDVCLF